MSLAWEQVGQRGVGIYWRAKTSAGFVRIQRVNKTGVPLFRLRWPDGMNITLATEEACKAQAEADMKRRKVAS